MYKYMLVVIIAYISIINKNINAAEWIENNDFRNVIAEAKEKVFPSVVFLMPISERYDAGKKEKAQVAGSGVIISSQGEVVTNWHVVNKATEIRCLLFDGSVKKAKIIGTDKDTDIALIKLEDVEGGDLPVAKFADSDKVEEGQFVMAMGAPWGLSRSVSLGILSCVNRYLAEHSGGYNLWLQTDASINPGNSGGPLIDTDGRIVGINTLGSIMGGNLAFAVPSNTVKNTVEEIRKNGRVVRAWTGIHLQPLKDFEKNIIYDADTGVLVASVAPNSPAQQAGVKVGDLILQVNDKEIKGTNYEDLPAINQMMANLQIGEKAKVKILRQKNNSEKEVINIELLPYEKGKVEGDDYDAKMWNMTVKTINEFATPMLYFFHNKGVYVQGIKYPGNAQTAGVETGDIILEVEGKGINSLEDFIDAYEKVLEDKKREKKVNLVVLRSGLKNYLVIDYAPKYISE